MRLPLQTRELISQLHPVAGIDSARLLLFSGDALSYVSFRRAQPGKNGTAGRNFLAPRRACSTHIRVARVSRLIGNSDTTAEDMPVASGLWGVEVTCGGCAGSRQNAHCEEKISPNAGNATPFGAASRYSRICHWPPRQIKGGGCFHRSYSGFPAGFSLLRAARWRLLLPGARCCSGSLDIPPAAGTSLALLNSSNQRSVFNFVYFQSVTRAVGPEFVLILEVRRRRIIQKSIDERSFQTHTGPIQRWHLGQ